MASKKPTTADRADRAVLNMAHAWWLSRRPVVFSAAEHMAHPAVNACTDAERALAHAVADRESWLAQRAKKTKEARRGK